jgi:hypothetical protein
MAFLLIVDRPHDAQAAHTILSMHPRKGTRKIRSGWGGVQLERLQCHDRQRFRSFPSR